MEELWRGCTTVCSGSSKEPSWVKLRRRRSREHQRGYEQETSWVKGVWTTAGLGFYVSSIVEGVKAKCDVT